MFDHAAHVNDNGFERQVIRAAQKLSFGVVVRNTWLATCAEILLKDFDASKHIPNCSNGALRFSMYVPAQTV